MLPRLVLFTSILLVALASVAAVEKELLRVRVATWNVAEEKPEFQLDDLLVGDGLPDIVVVGLQEVTMKPLSAAVNYFTDSDSWSNKIEETLLPKGYYVVGEERMVGIVLVVMARKELSNELTAIESWNVKTGLGGLFGNKGAVSVHLRLRGEGVCIVNSHLAAHDDKLESRIRDYISIDSKRHSGCDPAGDLVTVWLGDLNMRIAPEKAELTADRIAAMVKRNELEQLLANDQLNIVRSKGMIFHDFEEPAIKFRPTFKLIQGTMEYNRKRRPAWTDRILISAREPDAVEVLKYDAATNYLGSDHLPVVGDYVFHVSSNRMASNNGTDDYIDSFIGTEAPEEDSSGITYWHVFAILTAVGTVLLASAVAFGYIKKITKQAATFDNS